MRVIFRDRALVGFMLLFQGKFVLVDRWNLHLICNYNSIEQTKVANIIIGVL